MEKETYVYGKLKPTEILMRAHVVWDLATGICRSSLFLPSSFPFSLSPFLTFSLSPRDWHTLIAKLT